MGSCSVARSALQTGAGGAREARARSLCAWAGARRTRAAVLAAAVGPRPDATRFSRCTPTGTSATSMAPVTCWLPPAGTAAIDHTGTHAHLRGRPCLSYLAGSSFCRAFSRGLSLVSTGRPSRALCSSKHLRHALMSSWHHLRERRGQTVRAIGKGPRVPGVQSAWPASLGGSARRGTAASARGTCRTAAAQARHPPPSWNAGRRPCTRRRPSLALTFGSAERCVQRARPRSALVPAHAAIVARSCLPPRRPARRTARAAAATGAIQRAQEAPRISQS